MADRVFGYDGNSAANIAVTKQEFKKECNINVIVALFKRGAPLPIQIEAGQFVDVSELGDYKTALEQVMEAEVVWNTLPLIVKDGVGGDVAGFLDYVNDPQNAEQLVEWGLVAGPEIPAGLPVAAASGSGGGVDDPEE